MKAKNVILIRGRGTELPYSKRLLAESLINAGIASRVAQDIAKKVEVKLEESGFSAINKSQLREIVHDLISQDQGEDLAKLYPLREDLDYDIIVEGENGRFPYSKGIMAQSLMASGLPPNIAYDAARSIEMKLKSTQTRTITRENLRRMTYNILKHESSREHADRYLLWRELKKPGKPLIIMIGGATGVGKSTVAAEVAYRLGITRIICTDVIRAVMRGMISPGLLPAIHASSYSVAETLTVPLPEKSDPILIGFSEQVSKIAVGVNAVIERAAEEKISTVIEGVHVVPRCFPEHSGVHEIIIIIAVDDLNAHKARFYQRYENNIDRPPEKYVSHFEAIRDIQEYISKMARNCNIPVINNVNLDETVDLTLEEITKKVKELGIEPRIAFE